MKVPIIIIAGLLPLAFALVTADAHHADPVSVPKHSLRSVAYLFDATDSLTAHHRAFARRGLQREAEALPREATLLVSVLSGASMSPREIWTATCPGRAGDANPWTEGSDYVEQRFGSEILAPLDSVFDQTAHAVTSSTSPILEGLWQITNYSDFAYAEGPKRLVLISDLIQNTSTFSFYRTADSSFFAPEGQLLDPKWEANLSGVSVEVWVLVRNRDALLQGPQLIAQWERYLKRCGATQVMFKMVAP